MIYLLFNLLPGPPNRSGKLLCQDWLDGFKITIHLPGNWFFPTLLRRNCLAVGRSLDDGNSIMKLVYLQWQKNPPLRRCFYFHIMMGSRLFIMSKIENWRTNKIAQKLKLFRNLVFDFIVKNKDTTENSGSSVEPTAKIIFPIVISPILINGCVAIKANEIIKVSIDINTQNRGWFLKSILYFTSFTQPAMNK